MKQKGSIESEDSMSFTFCKGRYDNEQYVVRLNFSLLNPNSDKNMHTALHMATANDDPEIVRKLLSHLNINTNPISKMGLTPVMLATRKGKINALEVIFLLSNTELNRSNVLRFCWRTLVLIWTCLMKKAIPLRTHWEAD